MQSCPNNATPELLTVYEHAIAVVQLFTCECEWELSPMSEALEIAQLSIAPGDDGRFDSVVPTHDKYVCISKFILEYVPDRHPCRGLDIKLS